jgi:hypothetical protein
VELRKTSCRSESVPVTKACTKSKDGSIVGCEVVSPNGAKLMRVPPGPPGRGLSSRSQFPWSSGSPELKARTSLPSPLRAKTLISHNPLRVRPGCRATALGALSIS